MVFSIIKPTILGSIISLSGLAQQTPSEGVPDPAQESPSVHRSVALRTGSVDAVTGELSLRMPLGPRLPGRIATGFTWFYDSHSATHNDLGGDFRPVVWPSASKKRMQFTALVNGEPWTFSRNYRASRVNVSAELSRRGIDDGAAEALAYAQAYGLQVSSMVPEVYPSLDGQRFFISILWKLYGNASSPTNCDCMFLPVRRVLIDGDNTIWDDLKGTTHFTTLWGDHVTAKETNVTYMPNTTLWGGIINGATVVLRNENKTSQSITLTLSEQLVKVTNTMGFPEATLTGLASARPRFRSDENRSDTMWDFGFRPDRLEVQGDTGTLLTTFNWTTLMDGYNFVIRLGSLTHPNGLAETFTYSSTPLKRLGDYAFDPDDGRWMGFSPNSTFAYRSYQYWPVVQFSQAAEGKGRCVVFERTHPDWPEGASTTGGSISPVDHETSIRTYPAPTAGGIHRATRLIHAKYQGSSSTWGNPKSASEAEIMAAYLFATSAVQKAEFIGEDANIYRTIAYGGWEFRPFAGDLGEPWAEPNKPLPTLWDLPAAPKSTGVLITQPGLPAQVRSLTSYNKMGYGKINLGSNAPGAGSGVSLSTIPWGFGSVPTAKDVNTATDTQFQWHTLLKQLPTKVTRTLEGTKVGACRLGTDATTVLDTTTTSYDDLMRVKETATVTGSMKSREVRTFTGTNPQPTETTQYVSLTNGTELSLSGNLGKVFGYSPSPEFLLLSESDKLTGLATSYERDGLGRVSKTTDPFGVITTQSYDSWGQTYRTVKTLPGATPITTTYTYDLAGAWSQEKVEAEGCTLITRTDYDAFGRTIKVTRPDGSYQETDYNGYGEKISQSPWLKPGQTKYGVFTWTYDAKGRVTKTKDPKGRTLTNAPSDPSWDGAFGGVVTSVLDDRGMERKTVTDLMGQRKAVVDPTGKKTTFQYDQYGRMAKSTLQDQIREYTYNDLGWMTSRKEPEEGETKFQDFNALGRPGAMIKVGKSALQPITISTTFDAMGRPRTVNDSKGSFSRTLQYHPVFPTLVNSISEQQMTGTIQELYGFDAAGRLTDKTISDDRSMSFTMARTLDSLGNVTSLTYPSTSLVQGKTLTYTYDSFLRMKEIKGQGGKVLARMDYDTVSDTSVSQTLAFGNAASTVFVSDQGELSRVQHRKAGNLMVEDASLEWTAGGLLKRRNQDLFEYDQLGRLSNSQVFGLNGESVAQQYTYDAYGNRSSHNATVTGGTLPNETLNWRAEFGTDNQVPRFFKDPGGNEMLTGATYDDWGRLNSILAIPANQNSFVSWAYDAMGRVIGQGNGRFLLDAQGLRFRRIKEDGTVNYTVYGFNRDPLSTFEGVAPEIYQSIRKNTTTGTN